ncbi:hypothetical protein [Stenotrophomonas sp.]|uniref:hypothetical protein n=1 Tax=Stenotrophomonas sp. TaxID=69392 RepID=UPI0029A3B881|nr:hypothetical protein [Stenotrophomonas sp.]MDX3936374.1 hypothetical protein [Stenotrophomonas sp.]
MNADSGGVTGIPGIADGQVTATVADAWFSLDTTAHIVELTQRVERVHGKAAKRVAEACSALDAALQGHALEAKLRNALLAPLQRDCELLAEIAERVQVRLSLFAPACTQAAFDKGMDLQLQDIRAGEIAREQQSDANKPSAAPMPFGYWMSEDSFNRLERACSAALLLGSIGAGIGESMAIPFDAVAASANYVHEDLAAVVADATHTSDLDAGHDAH